MQKANIIHDDLSINEHKLQWTLKNNLTITRVLGHFLKLGGS